VEARRLYRDFVKEGSVANETPWERLSGQLILGTEGFIMQAKEMIGKREEIPEISRTQRHVGRPAVADIFPAETKITKQERNRLIHHAYDTHGHTLKEIAQALGVHYTTISKVINSGNN
jgi:putative transposase